MTGTGTPPGPWADADQYEHYVGRWSRLVARAFVMRLAVPAGRRWLDVGCGTGVLTQEVPAAADPDARELDEGVRFPLCRPQRPHELCTAADLLDVAVGEIVVPTVFTGFDDVWTPFLGGTGPAPSHVEALDEQDRAALREVLRSRIPTGEDGSIHRTARAWSVRGRR